MEHKRSENKMNTSKLREWEEVISEEEEEDDVSSLESLQEDNVNETQQSGQYYRNVTINNNNGLTPDHKIRMKQTSLFMTPKDDNRHNNGLNSSKYNNRTLSTHKQVPQDRPTPSMSKKGHEPILSPPFHLFSPAIPSQKDQEKKQSNASVQKHIIMEHNKKVKFSIDEEVENLVKRFNDYSRFTPDGKRKTKTNNQQQQQQQQDDPVDEDLESIKQKTNSMVDMLEKNYHSFIHLQNENMELKEKLSEYEKISTPSKKYDSRKVSKEEETKPVVSHVSIHEDEISDSYEMSTLSESGTKSTVSHLYLDPSDNHIHRSYPTIRKSPGTMFVTELLDHIELEVGHHAHLAQIMDRQWGTTNYM